MLFTGLGLITVISSVVLTLNGDTSSSSSSESSKTEETPDYYKETMDYCWNLTENELRDYVDYNYDLNKYRNDINFDQTKYGVVSDIAVLARKLGRSFNNRFDRY